jgi:hypothetical protein
MASGLSLPACLNMGVRYQVLPSDTGILGALNVAWSSYKLLKSPCLLSSRPTNLISRHWNIHTTAGIAPKLSRHSPSNEDHFDATRGFPLPTPIRKPLMSAMHAVMVCY